MTSDTISANASANSDVPRTRFGDFLLLAIFFVANAWFTLGNYFTVPEANDWDAYGQLPWMHRWADPSLFLQRVEQDAIQRVAEFVRIPPLSLRIESLTTSTTGGQSAENSYNPLNKSPAQMTGIEQ